MSLNFSETVRFRHNVHRSSGLFRNLAVVPAAKEAAIVFQKTLKQTIKNRVSSSSKNSRRLQDTAFAKVYARPQYFPYMIIKVGTSGKSSFVLDRHGNISAPVAGDRLKFLGGTVNRMTRDNANRGHIRDRGIITTAMNRSIVPAYNAFRTRMRITLHDIYINRSFHTIPL